MNGDGHFWHEVRRAVIAAPFMFLLGVGCLNYLGIWPPDTQQEASQ